MVNNAKGPKIIGNFQFFLLSKNSRNYNVHDFTKGCPCPIIRPNTEFDPDRRLKKIKRNFTESHPPTCNLLYYCLSFPINGNQALNCACLNFKHPISMKWHLCN